LQAMCLCYLNPPQRAQLRGKRTEYFEDKFKGNEERLSWSVGWTSVSERAETCRKKVNECQALALVASDTEIRLMYLELATQWRELAEYIETPDTPGGATIH
jgi:hypothetical protein